MITGVAIFLQKGTSGTCQLFAKPRIHYDSFGISDLSPAEYFWEDEKIIAAYSQDTFDVPDPPNPPVSRYENDEIYAGVYNGEAGRVQQYHLDDNTFYDPPFGKPGSTGPRDATPLQDAVLRHRVHDIAASICPEMEPDVFAGTIACSEGVNIIPFKQAWGANILITTRGPGVDDWYGVPEIGKFGWMATQYEEYWYGPFQWINFAKCRLMCIQG